MAHRSGGQGARRTPGVSPGGWEFLRRVRRRALVRDLAASALIAAVANEAVRWASIAAVRGTGWRIPVLDVGPPLLVVAGLFALRRWNEAAAARLADRRLGLSDRLTSLVDFRGRREIPDDLRRAQSREAGQALAEVKPSAVAAVRPWLALGPLALAASLAYPYFAFTSTETVTMQISRRLASGLRGAGRGAALPPGVAVLGTGREEPLAGEASRTPEDTERDPMPKAPPQARQAAAPDRGKARQGPPGDGDVPGRGDLNAKPPLAPPRVDEALEPAQLVSERVGTRLARVVDPLYAPGAAAAAPATAAGTVSIDLVPRGRAGRGTRSAPGRVETPERVAVDLDALPERYRPIVKTYFELLAAGPGAADGTTPPPGRSARP